MTVSQCNQINEAIDVCMELNQWQMALELAEEPPASAEGDQPPASTAAAQLLRRQRIERQLAQTARQLIDQGRVTQAVELYRRAGKPLRAAQLLFQVNS